MYDTAQDLVAALRAMPESLQFILSGYGHDVASAARGGDEGWSVVEVLCHLRDAEERALERMRLMRDQDMPLLAGYDQEQWAIERNYAGAGMADALTGFLNFRQLHVAELAALPADGWSRPGMHAEAGEVTIVNQAQHMASHDAIHLAQIARQLRETHRR